MPSERNRPKWSIASLVIQVAAFVVLAACLVVAGKLLGPFYVLAVLFFGVPIYILCSVLGIIFAVASFLRRERFMVVALAGLVVNCLPLVWLVANRNTQLFKM
jgi:uncharacterized membrane protein